MSHLLHNPETETIILRKKVKTPVIPPGTKKETGNRREPSDKGHLAKIERSIDEGDLTLPKVPISLRLEMQKARTKLNMTQADLAHKINEPLDLIKKYENGTIVPKGATIAKIKKCLGITGKF